MPTRLGDAGSAKLAETRNVPDETENGTADHPDQEIDELPRPIFLEDLTEEELDSLRLVLKITPAAKGSGLSDVSINHDKYLAEDEYERKLPRK